MAFEHYVYSGRERLRCGFTTGTCAALAAKAASRMLLTGEKVERVCLITPRGWTVEAEVEQISLENGRVACGVRKDGGDDIDVTDGLLICARVARSAEPGVRIHGGEGVGRVTREGLEQPVGAAAINQVPRRMIRQAAAEVLEELGVRGGLDVTIFVPDGVQAASRTFNPALGIEGGISILGTTGVVEPRSLQALTDTISLELRVHRAGGAEAVIFTPGNYGQEFLAQQPWAAGRPAVQCSNFIGHALDQAAVCGFSQVLLVGHIGKLVKLAGGVMDTHSRTADCRQELFCAHAALAGGPAELLEGLMQAATADGCIQLLDHYGLRRPVLERLSGRIQHHLSRRAGPGVEAGAVVFSRRFGPLFRTEGAEEILKQWEEMT